MTESRTMRLEDGCQYLAGDLVRALANDAQEVLLQINQENENFGTWTSTSKNLDGFEENIEALRTSTGTWHNLQVCWDDWDWNLSTNATRADGWPNMFDAGDTDTGIHWLADEGQTVGGNATFISGTFIR